MVVIKSMIKLTDPILIGDRKIVINIECTEKLDQLLTDNVFFATYNSSIKEVPDSILSIPAVANLAPVAWTTDEELYVPSLDDNFADALRDIQLTFASWYPDISNNKLIRIDSIIDRSINTKSNNPLLLFSGGVDSLASYIRHKSANPSLTTIHGADISLDNFRAWDTTYSQIGLFAASENIDSLFIRSNLRRLLDLEEFRYYVDEGFTGGWWAGLQHGLGLLGLTAPLAYTKRVQTVLIASSHTADYPYPWGSHPSIDNRVKWTGTTAVHDGYKLNRQDKIHFISKYINNLPELNVRSCGVSSDGRNCSQCEKCCRTILGMEINGLNPNEYGFKVDNKTFEHIQEKLAEGGWEIGVDQEWFWKRLQNDSDPTMDFPHEKVKELVRWLQGSDISEFRTT